MADAGNGGHREIIDVEAYGVPPEAIELASELSSVRPIRQPARRKPGRPMGSAVKKTPERVAMILAALEAGMSYLAASKQAGVSYSTVAEWRANDEEFNTACEKMIATFEMAHVKNIHNAAVEGDWKASAWLLSRKFPDRWSERKPEAERVNEIIIRWSDDGNG
jgi:lambda repressor-like predicted transcriptional regulator